MKILQVAVQSLLSIAVLFVMCRLTGKRSIHQLNTFDYINSITIGSIAAELATDLENWALPLTAMVVYGLCTALINHSTCKSQPLRRFFNGRPLVLYQHGVICRDNLLRAKLNLSEFVAQSRLAGYFDLQQLESAVMETNGQISFQPTAESRPAAPQDLGLAPPPESLFVSLIFDGCVLTENLHAFGRDERWLAAQLHAAGIGQTAEVLYACCSAQGTFRAYRQPRAGKTAARRPV